MAKPRGGASCRGCGGDGFVALSCQRCSGTGRIGDRGCPSCKSGRVNVTCSVCIGTGRDGE